MIYTRFGSPVEIVGQEKSSGFVIVKRSDGERRKYQMSDLKADGGAREIVEAIQAASR